MVIGQTAHTSKLSAVKSPQLAHTNRMHRPMEQIQAILKGVMALCMLVIVGIPGYSTPAV
jgi:hypothetical protein